MKSTKLLTILSIGIASWMHSCIEKKKTTDDKEVTAADCEKEKMKFNETDKKCVAPDEAFCRGLSLGFKASPPTCIAENGTGGGTGTSGSHIDTSVKYRWDGEKDPLNAVGVPTLAGKFFLQPDSNNKDPYSIRIWVAKGSNCSITTPPHDSNSQEIHAAAPAGTKECKIKFLAVNRKTKNYMVSKEYTIRFN